MVHPRSCLFMLIKFCTSLNSFSSLGVREYQHVTVVHIGSQCTAQVVQNPNPAGQDTGEPYHHRPPADLSTVLTFIHWSGTGERPTQPSSHSWMRFVDNVTAQWDLRWQNDAGVIYNKAILSSMNSDLHRTDKSSWLNLTHATKGCK